MNTENVQRFPYPSANSTWRVDHNRRDNRGDNPHNSNFQNEIAEFVLKQGVFFYLSF